MPTLTVARGESKKKEAASHVDFGAIWEIVSSDLVQHEVKYISVHMYILGPRPGLLLQPDCTMNVI